jgi:hypothetical protein
MNPFTYLGTDEKTLEFDEPADLSLSHIRDAFARIGKVVDFDADNRFLRGRTRYGLQRVWIEILVQEQGEGSIARVRSAADDVWGSGARRGVNKLLRAVTEEGGSFQVE